MVQEPKPSEVRPTVTVAIPTLAADETLTACLASLERQTLRGFEVIVVDNSGRQAVKPQPHVRVIFNERNVGFGAAVNQAFRASKAPFLAVLNDDTIACPRWLEALILAMEARPEAGMCASQVRLAGDGRLDSAGMLLCLDGSSKQRGHLESPEAYTQPEEVLLPSCSAALYRRAMLEEIGLFDESFFLYCEDTDLGLRARWAGWECSYVPDAVVEHRYSHSAGKASALKAFYVERNRLFLITKNFPLREFALAPFYSLARYFWHVVLAMRGRGKAAQFRSEGNSAFRLPFYVLRAHLEWEWCNPALWRQRSKIKRRVTPAQFRQLIRRFSISPRQVASL
jgi:GT2 family glycosyltransferase